MGQDILTRALVLNHKDTYNAHDFGPFSPPSLKLITGGQQHIFPAAIFHVDGGTRWARTMKTIYCWREASTHQNAVDAVLKAVDTYDEGNTSENERVIYDDATLEYRNFASGIMASGRLGILGKTRTAGGVTACLFLYSDDDGVTWSSAAVSGDAKDFMGQILSYPTSAGGDDTNGFIAYAYAPAVGIYYLKTTDNGANWTVGTALELTGSIVTTEPSVCRIGSEDKWVMIVRDDRVGVNAVAAKSTDMTTWTGWYDTGQKLGENPPYIMSYGDDLYWITFNRSGADYIIDEDYPDYMFHQKANAQKLWDSDISSWPGWSPFVPLNGWATGYLFIGERDGIHYGVFTSGERDSGAESDLILIRKEPAQIVDRESFGTFHFYRKYRDDVEIVLATNSAWGAVVTESGSTAQSLNRLEVATNNTVASTALLKQTANGLTRGTLYAGVNWDKRLLIRFCIRPLGVEDVATHVRYVQFKEVATYGDLGEKGLGIKMIGMTLKGESYGTGRGQVDLMTDAGYQAYSWVDILLDPHNKNIWWYVNKVYKGVQRTRDYIPTGEAAVAVNFMVSAGNPSVASDSGIEVNFPRIWQEL